MTVTMQQLERILTPLIERIIGLEERLQTEVTNTGEISGITSVNNLGEVSNPFNGQLIVVMDTSELYFFSSSLGFVQLV